MGTDIGEKIRGFKIPVLYRGESRDASTNNKTRNRLLRNAILNQKKPTEELRIVFLIYLSNLDGVGN